MVYALVDANSFYASAEQAYQPSYRGKPLIVLSPNDGIIVAANSLAQQYVKKFRPFFEFEAIVEQKNIIFQSSNFELYYEISERMMQTIGQFAPEGYVYSIDEKFLRYKDSEKTDWHDEGKLIRNTVWRNCRIPVCCGFGKTLTLAKLANQVAKLDKKTGVHVLITTDQIKEALPRVPCGKVWGIGRKLAKRLEFMGVHTALDLATMDITKVRKNFSVEVERVVRELRGEKARPWGTTRADKVQIFSSRTFKKRITERELLSQALANHAVIASRKLREQKSLVKVITAFAQTSSFDDKPVYRRQLVQLSYPTDDATVICRHVNEMLDDLFMRGVAFNKVGVGLLDLSSATHAQTDLFAPVSNDKLMKVFDKLNTQYGTDSVFLAAQGSPKQRSNWGMKRDKLSPRYLTQWSELPIVKC
ncbi:Y-family DNA polymerase [Photobacterium lutimaris]|uniref:DNA polymerase V subunit UmuC n=1 Tax=Photobacterium lutimaris TaxID=388278 RepID=A0A2T3ITN7_9GAMM|nr:Y-family DNA polymerase [Photobacterium lutimaris]PSU31724.1 DNA polymerase V subunit UmuC [Photobacterium lutimaris]TDR72636.1 DNA polymerase V [Photobacterium lutimaris]